MQNTRPTFLGIGAQKSGTSWMYQHFLMHPEIWVPPVKEIHFFDRSPDYPSPNHLLTPSPLKRIIGRRKWERPRMVTNLGFICEYLRELQVKDVLWLCKYTFGYYDENWYRGLFADIGSCKACGEITPAYSILNSEDVARIKAFNPDVKLFYLIRNPVERAWSALRFAVDRKMSNVDLDSSDDIITALKRTTNALRGNYEHTVETYLKHFDSSQILVCFYDAIKHDPTGLMSDVAGFLGVAPFDNSVIDNETRFNKSTVREMPAGAREYLLDTYSPMIERLAAVFGNYAEYWTNTDYAFGRYSSAAPGNPGILPTIHP